MWRRYVAAGSAAVLVAGAAIEAAARKKDNEMLQRGCLTDAGGYRVRIYETEPAALLW